MKPLTNSVLGRGPKKSYYGGGYPIYKWDDVALMLAARLVDRARADAKIRTKTAHCEGSPDNHLASTCALIVLQEIDNYTELHPDADPVELAGFILDLHLYRMERPYHVNS